MVAARAPVRTISKPPNALIVGQAFIAKLIPTLRALHMVAPISLLDWSLTPRTRLARTADLLE